MAASPSAAQRAPEARLAAKEETRQAAKALLASANVPGPRGASLVAPDVRGPFGILGSSDQMLDVGIGSQSYS